MNIKIEKTSTGFLVDDIPVTTLNSMLSAVAYLFYQGNREYKIPLIVLTHNDHDIYVWDEEYNPEWLRGKLRDVMDS